MTHHGISGTCKSRLNHVWVTSIEIFYQSSLHALLEHPRQTCPSRGLNFRPHAPQAGTLAKSYLDSLRCLLFGTSSFLLPYFFFHARKLRKRRCKSVPTNPQTSHTQLDMKAYFRPASPQNSAIRVYLNNKVLKNLSFLLP